MNQMSFYDRHTVGIWISIGITLCIIGIFIVNHDLSIDYKANVRSQVNLVNDITDCAWFKNQINDDNNKWFDKLDKKVIDSMQQRVKELKC